MGSGVAVADVDRGPAPGWRTATAVRLGQAVSRVSRSAGAGSGSVIGGRVTLALEPRALARLARSRQVALVSGTNGKTTTTRFLAAALATVGGPVATNEGGANLPAGLVSALASVPPARPGREPSSASTAALEVDEAWLPAVAGAVRPAALALLNLSRDQLDRVSEVRHLGAGWRKVVVRAGCRVVANADDPIVAWAAGAARSVTWVAAGQGWRLDAGGCPACEARIQFRGQEWWCSSCGLRRPRPDAWLDEECLALADGRRLPFTLALPGRFNRANAAMAAVTAEALGADLTASFRAMAAVTDVEGRYRIVALPGPGPAAAARLLLAKNPAGWSELLDVLAPAPAPVALAINARIADGRDPSWLWDVPFEALAGRLAVATGERRRDLAVRLRYAGVDHVVVAGLAEAVHVAAGLPGSGTTVDVVANYTAFQDLRAALAPRPGPGW